jgi:hypothetical protein
MFALAAHRLPHFIYTFAVYHSGVFYLAVTRILLRVIHPAEVSVFGSG